MTDIETVRAALHEAAKSIGFQGVSLAPVPGSPVGDAHLALDRIELALKFIAQEAKQGRLEVAQGVPNAPTFWLEAIEARARAVVVDESAAVSR